MIQGSSLLLLLYLFCSLVVAACTTTARPSQSTQVATAATAAETPQPQLNRSPRTRRKSWSAGAKRLPGHASSDATVPTQAERDQRQQDDRESGESNAAQGGAGVYSSD